MATHLSLRGLQPLGLVQENSPKHFDLAWDAPLVTCSHALMMLLPWFQLT